MLGSDLDLGNTEDSFFVSIVGVVVALVAVGILSRRAKELF